MSTDDIITIVDPELRTHLLAFARKHAPKDAEDQVQEALLATWKSQPRNPRQYAFSALRNLCARAGRSPMRAFLSSAEMPLPGSDDVLDTAESFLRADAALEQVLVWGDGGTTHVTVPSLHNIDILRIRTRLRAAIETFDLLPCSDRHRRRQRTAFEKRLATAFASSRSRIDPSLRDLRDEAPGEDDQLPVQVRWDPDAGFVWSIVEPAMNRAFGTARRYGDPKSKHFDLITIAAEAARRAWGEFEP